MKLVPPDAYSRWWKSASVAAAALLARREQPRHNVEEQGHRSGHQRQSDEPQPDDGRVDAGVIGETGGDAHNLGVAAVDEETSVHFSFLWLSSFRRSAATWRPRRAEARR